MAKKTMLTEAQELISEAAKTGAAAVKPVASAALAPAAAAAAGVVLDSVSDALKSGGQKVERATPEATEAVDLPRPPRASRAEAKKPAR